MLTCSARHRSLNGPAAAAMSPSGKSADEPRRSQSSVIQTASTNLLGNAAGADNSLQVVLSLLYSCLLQQRTFGQRSWPSSRLLAGRRRLCWRRCGSVLVC